MKVVHVVGARPNFVKVAPLMLDMASYPDRIEQSLIHTGQHYDLDMSDVFFADLGLPPPDVNLGVGSGSHAWQTAEVMHRLEPVLTDLRPDWLIVVGDVNSTLASALVAAKLGVPIAHVEAGLRSFDRTMPEEINRVLTDHLADLLFVSEASGVANLEREGIAAERICFAGNIMIDSLVRLLPKARTREILGQVHAPFVLVTLHRPANVDDPQTLRAIAAALADLTEELTVVFPVHPRTRATIDELGLAAALSGCRLLPPLGYLDFLALEQSAALVITDSGGVQEETTFLGVPCLTVRPNTERPVTISEGTNQLVAAETVELLSAARVALRHAPRGAQGPPALWDGQTAQRITEALLKRCRRSS